MLKYPCLVLDHDDTVVQTERSIGYPYFLAYLQKIRPGAQLSFQQYVLDCQNMLFPDMCREKWGFTEEEQREEYAGWQEYCRSHIPPIFPGIDRIIRRQKAEGGLVCVASLSSLENITRDYRHHFGFLPDAIYHNDLPRHQRKPNPWPLEDLMEKFSLKPADILMVDDMKMGWSMASALGTDTAYAAWGRQDFPDLMTEMKEICSFSFDSTEEFEDFLF